MFQKIHPVAGSRPGTLIIPEDALASRIRVVQYDRDNVESKWVRDADELQQALATDKLVWVHVQGLRSVDLLLLIAEHFGIHPLSLEDVVNVPHRPKQEAGQDYVLAVTRAVRHDQSQHSVTEQVTLILGKRFVLSFQESHQPRFQAIVKRMQRPDARLRRLGSDYLAYALLDTVVDGYFPVLEEFGEELERLESVVLTSPHPRHLQRIAKVKRRLISLRRTTWAQREMVGELLREGSSLATREVEAFTRDTFDHCVQIAEVVDMYRESATGLVNTYLSSVGQRTNEIMKTLTIVGSIFIPLTFLAGIYGMNFEHMPELHSRWAYPTIWIAMVVIAAAMLAYFYRCGWIGTGPVETSAPDADAAEDPRFSSVQTSDWDQQLELPMAERAA